MQIFRSIEEIVGKFERVFLAIGVFDGVHLGHQHVIGQARDDAQSEGGASVVLTFDPHPMQVLQPDKAPQLLTSTPHKLRLIEKLGVNACLVLGFDKAFSLLPPERFVEKVAQAIHLREICVGTRFRFGHNRDGDVHLLKALAPKYGFSAQEIQPVKLDDEMISSTVIRQHVLNGRLDRAGAMLGRPFSIVGTVMAGDRRGHELGFPTANVDSHSEVLPPDGVYAVRILLGRGSLGGVANVGVRPTFEQPTAGRVLEVHILDFDNKIYGQEIEVEFVKKLREEQRFESIDALKRQIAADAQAAGKLLGNRAVSSR
ncbi:MAG TPA: bifunctional riboflavin kinase/FAD synthetase [Verrucomicrobiae bacterium]|nr:bifunctional riboflavin kinase/FAD synthetase [Verrucomicrobiae bacterium]